MKLQKKLSIAFWIWGPFDTGEGGAYHDCDARMRELTERGFNCVRMESGAGLLNAPDGTPRGKVNLHSPFGKYSPMVRQMIVTRDIKVDIRQRLLDMFRAADKHDVSIILSSWYYLHTNWFLDEEINKPLFAMTTTEKMWYFARELDAILSLLRENGLAHRVAFAELFNELDGIDFCWENGNFASREQTDSIRKLHEDVLAWLKERNPDVRFAYDFCSWDGFRLIPKNADVLNLHNYYMWPVYGCIEQGQIGNASGEIHISPETQKYFGEMVSIDDVDRERRYNLRTGRAWSDRVALYASLKPEMLPELDKMLQESLEKNAGTYLEVLRERMIGLKIARDMICPEADLVMGEGVTYCCHNDLRFEENSRLYWQTVEEAIRILKGLGFAGCVVRTTSGPEDPSWYSNVDDYRRINGVFQAE